MVKPMRVGELAARVRALLRRAYLDTQPEEQVWGRYRFVLATRQLEIDGRPVALTQKEFDLALFAGGLVDHLRGRIASACMGRAGEGRRTGIAEELRTQVFEPFVRGSATANIDGAGLGLAFVKTVAQRHGGKALLDSALGRGSAFRLVLPRA
ncbi:ATP-binding protein [Variovorax sp. LjRoot175]|uniref:sensor histidine kinase n=1 Tax=Variovorax sp. LjRoot175 TaxID=3342276 RepID=UPI003ECD108D